MFHGVFGTGEQGNTQGGRVEATQTFRGKDNAIKAEV